jgi:hypothetical protein
MFFALAITAGTRHEMARSGAAGPAQPPVLWTSVGQVEGHLARNASPAGAFSANSATLAIVARRGEQKVALFNLANASIEKVLHPAVVGLKDLEIYSASFVAPNRLFMMARGAMAAKKRHGSVTPMLGFEWDTTTDSLVGKVDTIGANGFRSARYFPQIGFVGMYKQSTFDLWDPANGRGLEAKIPDLTERPRVYAFSPDGHWLILAQIENAASQDPVVVQLKTDQFVNSLRGHHGAVMSIAFSRDSTKVATACEDGMIRVWSVPGWKLLHTLAGHEGPVHWAEFSPRGRWIASAGEDATVRLWSTASGQLMQTLSESRRPVLTVAFSPNGQYLAATTEHGVFIWKRIRAQN